MPSKSYVETRLRMASTKMVLLAADPTAVEKYREPVQPPTVSMAATSYNILSEMHPRYSAADVQTFS